MSHPAHHEPAILQGRRRVRYLKLIALFKIAKGVLLLVLGVSLLFLNARTRWTDAISDWTADEILLEHSKAVHYSKRCWQAARCARQVFWRCFTRQFSLPKASAFICSNAGLSC